MLTVFEDENKSNGITITRKRSEEANYPHISIYLYINNMATESTRTVLMAPDQGSILLAVRVIQNAIFGYNFW